MIEYIPGIIAYFVGGFLIWTAKVFVWKISSHWSKFWVGDYWKTVAEYDVSQADAQILSLSVIITVLIMFGISILIWSIANYINCKNTEQGFPANFAGGIGIATAIGSNLWLNDLATKLTTYME